MLRPRSECQLSTVGCCVWDKMRQNTKSAGSLTSYASLERVRASRRTRQTMSKTRWTMLVEECTLTATAKARFPGASTAFARHTPGHPLSVIHWSAACSPSLASLLAPLTTTSTTSTTNRRNTLTGPRADVALSIRSSDLYIRTAARLTETPVISNLSYERQDRHA